MQRTQAVSICIFTEQSCSTLTIFQDLAARMGFKDDVFPPFRGILEGGYHQTEAGSSSYFSTHPSAPHSLRISVALTRFSLAFKRSPFR